MTKYMKNNFQFYGVRAPILKRIFKEEFKQHSITEFKQVEDFIRQVWNLPHREFQYLGMYMLDQTRPLWAQNDNPVMVEKLFEFMITNKSWWDTVDFISSSLIFYWWKCHPEFLDKDVAPKWNQSDNFWLIRTSIIYQLKRRNQTDIEILKLHILNHTDSKEFFVQKAIGWVLREYAKTNTNWVIEFVENHPELKPLSKREALKQIKAGRIKKPW